MGKPKIRFEGYSEDWEQRKLGNTSKKVCVGFVGTCEKYYTDETGIPMYRTGNLNGLSLNKDDMKYVTRDFHQQNKKSQLKFGDILIARHGDSGKAVNYESSEEANCLNIVIIRPDFKKCNYRFLTDCINSPRCQKHIKSLSAGSTQAVINTSEIEKLEVLLPESIDEQEKIAAYFENLDHLITLHQRKCDETKTLKKYMLQKMFPQNGEKVPELRFDGFTEDWEQRKLGDVAQEFKSGNSLKADEIDITGDYPVYGGNGLRGYTSTYNHDGEYALIGRQGALCGNMNYSVGKAYFTEHAVVVKADENNDTRFLYYMLDTMNLGQYSDQSAQPGLAVNKLVKLENRFSTKEEQQRMGWYFSNIDHLITLHQRKCNELKEIKKYMLQNMFV